MEQFNSSSRSQPFQERFCSLTSAYPSKPSPCRPLPGVLRQLSACHDNHKRKRCDALPAMRKVKKNLSFQKRKGGWRGGRESAQSPLASSAGGPDDILQRMGGDAESRPQVPIVPQTRCDCEQVTAHPSLVSPPVA